MRNLDNFESILDNDKNFLHGKLCSAKRGLLLPNQYTLGIPSITNT